MKNVEQQNIKKLCNFYVSDLHLSVMLLPYISRMINEDVEITTIFEKIEKEDFEKVLNKLNVKNKEKILNINWFNNKKTEEKFKELLKENNKKNILIIGGNEKYVKNKNEKIIKIINEEKINVNNTIIINCFNVEEMSTEMKDIIKKYDGVLNTSGELLSEKICS